MTRWNYYEVIKHSLFSGFTVTLTGVEHKVILNSWKQ